MIGIVDYGSGNIRAIANIYERLKISARVVDDAESILEVDKLILPGVGAFDDSMIRLNKSGMREALDSQVLENGIPILGVCVGMQMMACSSEEGREAGLGWFTNSRVVRFDENTIPHKPKLPHMGWNNVVAEYSHPIFDGVDEEKGFYFLHSFYFICEAQHQLATTQYGSKFTSAVHSSMIFGFQFHPEKSHGNGVNIFRNFAGLI